ncbi:MAG TPA: ADP-ribosylglycohydrolase family protein [Armatimonadota bacterium]|nr:ADP-ribosylglycohydrolase family protein [Armatimonadota bacterium]
MIVLNAREYYDRVYGCWFGKNIGGTLGGPVEGHKEIMQLDFYPKLPKDGPAPNDDLDLQLLWLHALEQYGILLTAHNLGQEWLDHCTFPYDEYGYGLWNLRKQLEPPLSGWYNNWFRHGMGCPIRSEIWACIAPGLPQVAAAYAYQDAIVDHSGESVYAEMFYAAMESAAFVLDDRDSLLDIGLAMIPPESLTARAVQDLRKWHREGLSWTENRSRILEHYGHDNFTDSPQNIAFTILGWLYGKDFGDMILTSVNCGYDTDCTGATLGAILGIRATERELPERWKTPVGDAIRVSPEVNGFQAPMNLDELTQRTVTIGRQVIDRNGGVRISDTESTDLSAATVESLSDNQAVRELWVENHTRALYPLSGGAPAESAMTLAVEYGEFPTIGAGTAKKVQLILRNQRTRPVTGRLLLEVPEGWSVNPDEPQNYTLNAGEEALLEFDFEAPSEKMIYPSNPVRVIVDEYQDGSLWQRREMSFPLLGEKVWYVAGPLSSGAEATESDWKIGDPYPAAPTGADFLQVPYPENRLDLDRWPGTDAPGVYYLATTLYSPEERPARLIAASSEPVTVWLNGKQIINREEGGAIMPATHRPRPGSAADVMLQGGENRVLVKIKRQDGGPFELWFLAANPARGRQHHFVDVINL